MYVCVYIYIYKHTFLFHFCHCINMYSNWLGEQSCTLPSNMLYILSLQKNLSKKLTAGVSWYSRACTIKRQQSPHNARSRQITFSFILQKVSF